MNSSNLRYLPNVISSLRLAAIPLLAWLAYQGYRAPFAWLLVGAGVTDILDGWLARRFNWVSRAGALLDSIADVLLVLVTLYGVWMLHKYVITEHPIVIWSVFSIWFMVHLGALLRYGRLASFHTWFTRFGVALFGLFAIILFFFKFVAWFYYGAAAICFLGGVESLVMILLLPQWTPNIHGGLVEVLRRRAASD